MKRMLLTFGLLGIAIAVYSQTVINLAYKDTFGHPMVAEKFLTSATGISNGIYYLINTIYISGEQENFQVIKYDAINGNAVWERDYNNLTNERDFGVDGYVKGAYVYMTGISWDSVNAKAAIITMKLDTAAGDTVWTRAFTGAYNGYNLVGDIMVDDNGNVYVTGTEQKGSLDYAITVIKYDSAGNENWVGNYDSTGMYNGAAAMQLISSHVVVTGFSGTGFGSWDFVTAEFDKGSGSLLDYSRSSNVSGSFSKPVGLIKDEQDNLYVLGTSSVVGSNTDIKLIAYDSLLNEVYVKTYGDSLLPDEANYMEADLSGGLLVCGTRANSTGGKDIVVLKYHRHSGTLLWAKTINGSSPTGQAIAKCIVADTEGNVCVTGKISNGSDYDIITGSFTPDGTLSWVKTFDRGGGSNDSPDFIYTDDNGNVYVTATGAGADTVYQALKYEKLKLGENITTDTSGTPLFINGQVIVKFNRDAVLPGAVNNKDLMFGEPSVFLKQWAIDSLNTKMPFPTKGNVWFARIFTGLKTSDTISISRLGERIPIPDFWSAFLVVFPKQEGREKEVRDSLDKLFPFVESAEYDILAGLASVPNDQFYEYQEGLHPVNYPNADINVEEAWNYETGKPFIKVGIFDSGLYLEHRDFYPDDNSFNTGTNSVAKLGWSYFYNAPVFGSGSDYGDMHGTHVGGIIGAVRNNSVGVAGIAGGDSSNNIGVSLYGYNVTNDAPFSCDTCTTTVASAHNVLNGLVDIATQSPDSLYGRGINILNHSFTFYRFPLFDPIYAIDSVWQLLISAYHYANRNKVVMPCAVGNDGLREDELFPFIEYPSAFDDDWVLAVGGTGFSGGYRWYFDNSDVSDWMPNYGKGIDIAAPCGIEQNYTTNFYYPTSFSSYDRFNGTSAATPQASGVAALLMSYLNDSIPAPWNLAPEDVEYIVQRSAFNVDTPGYDILTGYGRLNAGGALSIVDTSKRKLYHINSEVSLPSGSISLILGNTPVKLKERARTQSGVLLDRKTYYGNAYKITKNIGFALDDSIVGYWERPSSSFTFPPLEGDSLIPHEKIRIESISNTGATVSGYVYELYDSAVNNWVWLPFDTTDAKAANFAISIITGDSIQSPWDSIINSNVTINNDFSSLNIYPNPTTNYLVVEASSNCPNDVKIDLFDMNGKEIKDIFTGRLDSSGKKIVCDMTAFEQGVYFISLQTYCDKKFLKLIKL